MVQGRRYHAFRDGEYPLPNDEQEQDRLDLLHHFFLLILDGNLHLAPISKDVQRVLDVGTGTGITYTLYHFLDPEFADTPCSTGIWAINVLLSSTLLTHFFVYMYVPGDDFILPVCR